MSGSSHLWLGVTALQAFRQGIGTAGYNVANAGRDGFSRRRVELGPLDAAHVRGGHTGLGVEVVSIRRERDVFLDFAVRREMGRLSSDDARTQVLSALEPLLGEVDGAPLQGALSRLFDAFEALGAQADSIGVRLEVTAAAEGLASAIRRANEQIGATRSTVNQRVRDGVARVNDILEQLAQNNAQQAQLEADGSEASDLRDERDRLLDELSSLIGARGIIGEDGKVSVFVDSTGDTLLTGTAARELRLVADSQGLDRIYLDRAGEPVDMSDMLRGGEIGGYLAMRDETLTTYAERVDTLAAAVIEQFNLLHQSGFDLDGAAGLALFEPDPPGADPAAAMRVNALIAADPRTLAAASAPGAPGDGGNANAFVDLRKATIASLGDRRFTEFAADFVAEIGRDTSTAEISRQASQEIVSALETKRERVSGVSLDEEAAELVRWQQSFQAAARFMQVVNEVNDIALQLLAR
ncbi:MAG: flagellar hook-associated protein FlgK [Acidobacteriota bacterium]|nr:MAG: flagellar hook-associated protein FlgK [Acidobacteriota bacterium]